MPNAIAYKNLVEVVARVFFVQQLQSYDGKGVIKLELTNSRHTLTAQVDAALVRGKDKLIDGEAYRCQIVREQDPLLGEYRILGMTRYENPEKLFTPLIPLGGCVRDEVAEAFQALNLSWKNPGLRNFMARVFSNPEFAAEWVMAPRAFDCTDVEPNGLMEEAVYACFQIRANPFLTSFQKEIAMAALILSRPGRQWVRGNDSMRVVVPESLHLAPADMKWLSICYPDTYSKLMGIWASLDTADPALDHAGAAGVLYAATWMALGYLPPAQSDFAN